MVVHNRDIIRQVFGCMICIRVVILEALERLALGLGGDEVFDDDGRLEANRGSELGKIFN